MDPTVEERVALYVRKLQEAALASGYGVISKDTLLKVVRQYVSTYKPPERPGDRWEAAPVVPRQITRESLPPLSVNFKDYAQPKLPETKQLPPTNVVDIFSKKK